jgi:hypothetical protein
MFNFPLCLSENFVDFFEEVQIFKQILQYTVLIEGISTIFIDLFPTYLIPRKVHSVLESEFSTIYYGV